MYNVPRFIYHIVLVKIKSRKNRSFSLLSKNITRAQVSKIVDIFRSLKMAITLFFLLAQNIPLINFVPSSSLVHSVVLSSSGSIYNRITLCLVRL